MVGLCDFVWFGFVGLFGFSLGGFVVGVTP